MYRAQLQMWADAQIQLAAAASETWQPERKRRTGVTSSMAVHRAPALDAASGPTLRPSMYAVCSMVQGLPVAASSSHGHPPRALPPTPAQAPLPMSSPPSTNTHGTRFKTPSLRARKGSQAVLSCSPRAGHFSAAPPCRASEPAPQLYPPPYSCPPCGCMAGCPNTSASCSVFSWASLASGPGSAPGSPLPPAPGSGPGPGPKRSPGPTCPRPSPRRCPKAQSQLQPCPQGEPQAQMTASPSKAVAAPAAAPTQRSGYEVVWAKFGDYPWWPATVSFTSCSLALLYVCMMCADQYV